MPSPQEIRINRLRSDLKIFPGGTDARGMEMWTIFDPVSDSYIRISDDDYKFIMLLDREQSIGELIERIKKSSGDSELSSVMMRLNFLEAHRMFLTSYGKDTQIVKQGEMIRKKIFLNRIMQSYLFLNIPLLKPDPFFERTAPLVSRIFNKTVIMLLAVISLAGYFMIVQHADRLNSIFWESFHLQGIAGYLAAIVILKAAHEAAHAYAARCNGIRVRKMGIAFIVFFPRFYTDITDAWRISDRKKRALIDSAGIILELIAGGFAAIIWVYSVPGVINTIAYSIFTVSVLNTIFVNGNPFIRYDGYYLLMDIVNIDNLYMRGTELLRNFIRQKLFGIPAPNLGPEFKFTDWHRQFIVIYAVLSICYRIFLYSSIILIVYVQFTKAVGIILFALEAYLLIIKPLSVEIRAINALKKSFVPKNVKYTSITAGILIFILCVPIPFSVSMPGEVLPEISQSIYAKSPGFIKMINKRDGSEVKKGDLLFILENPYLNWDERDKTLDLAMQNTWLDQVQSDKKHMEYFQLEKKHSEAIAAVLAELQRRKGLLMIKAELDGTFILADRNSQRGKWVNEGELIAEIINPERQLVYAYAPESEIGNMDKGDSASAAVNGILGKFSGKVQAVNRVPLKKFEKESPVLEIFGGTQASYISQDDGLPVPVNPIYRLCIAPSDGEKLPYGRGAVVYVNKYSSIAGSIFRKTATAVQREFSF